jgi:hypothetical protein
MYKHREFLQFSWEVLIMEHIKKTFIWAVVMNCAMFIYQAYGVSEKPAAQADVKLQQVALFKNGLGFFISEAAIPKNKETFNIVPCGAPSHGTFWVAYPPRVKLESLTVKEIDSEGQVDVTTIQQMLEANEGKKVRLYFKDDKRPPTEGVIKYFTKRHPWLQSGPYSFGRLGQASEDYVKGLMMIKTESSEAVITPDSVASVEFLDGKPEKTFNDKTKSTQLEVKLAKSAGGEKLTLSYLAKGITWAPSYMVDITQAENAMVSAKAVVINEVCDLDDVKIQLVTGFPHLQFADIVSPLALKENLAQFLQSLISGQSERGRLGIMSNVMVQRADFIAHPMAEEPRLMPAYGAAEEGKVAEDLFFYPVEKVHLAKREVGYFPLFTESIPYKHIYEWEIPDYINEEDYYYQRRRQPEEPEPKEVVWHCLRMENTTKVPWTTAPAEVVKEGLILGQDTLNYTPTKGETTLRITQAASVKAEQLELETDRKRDAAQLYGYHYDLVTVDGKLSVTNFKPNAITLEITKTLSGELKSSQPEAKIEKLARGLQRMNTVLKLTWTIELEPGEQKQLGYIYEVYVRR